MEIRQLTAKDITPNVNLLSDLESSSVIKLGIQTNEGTIVVINNVTIEIGKTGIYELDNRVKIDSVLFPQVPSNTLVDFVLKY